MDASRGLVSWNWKLSRLANGSVKTGGSVGAGCVCVSPDSGLYTDCDTGVIGCGCWGGGWPGLTSRGGCDGGGTIVDPDDGDIIGVASYCEGSAVGSGKTGWRLSALLVASWLWCICEASSAVLSYSSDGVDILFSLPFLLPHNQLHFDVPGSDARDSGLLSTAALPSYAEAELAPEAASSRWESSSVGADEMSDRRRGRD